MPGPSIPFIPSVSPNNRATLYELRESERLPAMTDTLRATLPCPKLAEADPADVLDPAEVFETVHVLVEYPQMARHDILTVHWRGANPLGCTCSELTITNVVEGHPLRLAVGAEFVMPNMGQQVLVRYTLWRAATQAIECSSTLSLLVRELIA